MQNVCYKIILDANTASSQHCLSVTQGDTARGIQITLVDNGKPYDFSNVDYVQLEMKRPGGTLFIDDCDINKDDNIIVYSFNEETAIETGLAECSVVLYDQNGLSIASPKFDLAVRGQTASKSVVESSDSYKNLVNALINLNLCVDDVETLKKSVGDWTDEEKSLAEVVLGNMKWDSVLPMAVYVSLVGLWSNNDYFDKTLSDYVADYIGKWYKSKEYSEKNLSSYIRDCIGNWIVGSDGLTLVQYVDEVLRKNVYDCQVDIKKIKDKLPICEDNIETIDELVNTLHSYIGSWSENDGSIYNNLIECIGKWDRSAHENKTLCNYVDALVEDITYIISRVNELDDETNLLETNIKTNTTSIDGLKTLVQGYDDSLLDSTRQIPAENYSFGKYISASTSNSYANFSKHTAVTTQNAVSCMYLPVRFGKTYTIDVDFTSIAELLQNTGGTLYPFGHSSHGNATIVSLHRKTDNGFETVGARRLNHHITSNGGEFVVNQSSACGEVKAIFKIDDSFFTTYSDSVDFSSNVGTFTDGEILYLSFNLFYIISPKTKITEAQWSECLPLIADNKIYNSDVYALASVVESLDSDIQTNFDSIENLTTNLSALESDTQTNFNNINLILQSVIGEVAE